MKWNGKNIRPVAPTFRVYTDGNRPSDPSLKRRPIPVWRSVMSVQPDTSPVPPVSPTQTPTNTPTPSVTPVLVDCTWSGTSTTWENNTNQWNDCLPPPPPVSPSETPTNTPTPSVTPTFTPTQTITPTQTETPTQTPTITPSPSSPPLGYAEAETYMSAVIAGGGTLDATMSGATYQLFNDLFVYGLWSKIKAFYPLLGGNSSGGQAVNGKTPGTRNMIWNGGLTFSTNGVQGNGTTGFGNTQYVETSQSILNNIHIGLYCNVNAIKGSTDMGATDNAGEATTLRIRITGDLLRAQTQNNFNFNSINVSNNNSTGCFIIQRTASNSSEAFRNGSSLGTGSQTSTGRVFFNPYYVLAQNYASSGALGFSDRPYQFFTMGDSFTPTEITNYTTAITNFQTTLGRA